MSDFSSYGGPSKEWLAVEASIPALPTGLSAVELRTATNTAREQNAAENMKALADKVHLADHAIPTRDGSTIEARTYWPVTLKKDVKTAVYIHFHGGGYIFGTLATEDAVSAALALRTNILVLNVNYRHTPEHTYPTQFDDALDAFVWVHGHASELGIDPDRVVVGGISAGAHIASSLTLEQHLGRIDNLAPAKLPTVAGQVLMIPTLVNMDCYTPQLAKLTDPSVSSYKENKTAPLLSASTVRFFTDLLKAPNPDPNDTKLNPGNARPEQIRGLPPAVFGICGLDPLRDEGLLYAKMLAEEGVPTNVNVFKGVPHGFRRFGEKLSVAKAWDSVMEQGILWALSQPKATGKFDVQVHSEESSMLPPASA